MKTIPLKVPPAHQRDAAPPDAVEHEVELLFALFEHEVRLGDEIV